MKKVLAIFMVLAMLAGCVALTACGKKDNNDPTDSSDQPSKTDTVNVDDIPDTMNSTDGKYVIAMVTDVGQLKDKSFNQGTWNGVKLYASQNSKSYKYYQPANKDQATDDDRYDAMKAAAEGGAKVIVAAGFMQATALTKAAAEFTDVKFVFVDRDSAVTTEDGTALKNVLGICFQEEQCGYLAGYAVVKEGFEKLGFTGGGGGTNPACVRYGYGFAQGANAAAAEMGKTVELNYTWQYGNSYSPSSELQALVNGWYNNGTEVIFCCGGNMYQSVAQAAAENDAYMVGVDTDQSPLSETIITSAMKGLSDGVQWGLAYVFEGSFADIAGKSTTLSAKENAVGLPTATWSLTKWTVDDYNAMLAKMADGSLVVDNDYSKLDSTDSLTLNLVK